MYDSSEGFRSMIGGKDTDDVCFHTGTSVIACIKPDQFDRGFSGELVNQPAYHKCCTWFQVKMYMIFLVASMVLVWC